MTYRRSRLRRPILIPWPVLMEQFGSRKNAARNFRVEVQRGLGVVRVFYYLWRPVEGLGLLEGLAQPEDLLITGLGGEGNVRELP